ncbi:MAG: hypothetical protein QF535_19745, partial [Anaerolineales bacterium]|nr:hypothetical protein [Anaerolineales bacterium]
APSSPSFDSGVLATASASTPGYVKPIFSPPTLETINALTLPSKPVAPSSPSFTYSSASTDDITRPIVGVSDMAALDVSAPSYTKPVLSLTSNPSITDLDINAVAPVSPESPSIDSGAIAVGVSTPTYVKPSFSAPALGTVNSLTLPSVPVKPSVSAQSVTITGQAPTYVKPLLALTSIPATSWVFPSPPVRPQVSAQVVADFSTSNPDYIAPPSPSLGEKPTIDDLTISITPPVAPSLTVVSHSDASATDMDTSSIVITSASAPSIVDVSAFAPTYNKPVFSAPSLSAVGDLTLPSVPVAPSSPSFTYDDVTGIADIVEPIVAISDMSALDTSAPSYTKPTVVLESPPSLGDLTISATLPTAPVLSASSDSSISFSQPAPTYTGPVVSPDFSQAETYIETDEDIELANAKLKEIDTRINEFQAKVQNASQEFNKENTEYQAQLQISIQNAQLNKSDDSGLLQKYSIDLQKYQADVNTQIQEYQQNLESDTKTWQAGRQTDLQKYG